MKKPLHIALFLLALAPVGVLAVQQSRPASVRPTSPIAFLSVQKVLNESAQAKAAAKQLDDLRKTRADDLNARKKKLDDTKLALANAGGVFSGSRRAELRSSVQRQEAELKQATEDAQKAILDLQHQLQGAIREDLVRALNDVARERPLQYVLNADTSLVWARDATDLTADILERMNNGAGKTK
ncbi:MAG: OmpH family outer membrane protein [Acidobacteria bacterium]|nr:OmpH family outer membrane protein [Acidobacteriota bacterium]